MLEKVRKIHLIGIGGTGMRAIANILIAQGFTVSGSDIAESPVIERLRKQGATIYIGHDGRYVEGVDAVVHSTAIHKDNPELLKAKELGLTIFHRSDIVKAVINSKKGIAVAGAHGKTTTTSMLGQIFMEAQLDPTIIIGGEVTYLNGSSHWGTGDFAIAEADESDGSFLSLRPQSAIITNIENDHMDHYGSLEALRQAFVDFANVVNPKGVVVVCGDNEGVQSILSKLTVPVCTYGLGDDNDFVAKDLKVEGTTQYFAVYHQGQSLVTVGLQVPGAHNVLNALGAFALAHYYGLRPATIAQALGDFCGAKRRFETKGKSNGVWVVDDYAHHPTEIAATLRAAKTLKDYRVVCVFQPHRYTRTELLLNEYGSCFKDADVLYITDIYSAGEEPIPGIDGHSIPKEVELCCGQTVHYIEKLEEVPRIVGSAAKPQDLILTMGAGNISSFGPKILAVVEEGNER